MINIFKEYQGKNITIEGYRTEFYVPNVEEKEEFIMEAQEGLCFEREGFEIVAVEGHIEEGELIQWDGLLAININTGEVVCSEEGTEKSISNLKDLNITVV